MESERCRRVRVDSYRRRSARAAGDAHARAAAWADTHVLGPLDERLSPSTKPLPSDDFSDDSSRPVSRSAHTPRGALLTAVRQTTAMAPPQARRFEGTQRPGNCLYVCSGQKTNIVNATSGTFMGTNVRNIWAYKAAGGGTAP